MPTFDLPETCPSVPSCGKPRLQYRGYCADHGPATPPLPPTRCLAVHGLRCYCPECSRRNWPACDLPPTSVILARVKAQGRGRHLAAVQ